MSGRIGIHLRLFVSSISMIASLFLMYVLFFIMYKACLVCLATHVVNTGLLLCSVLMYWKTSKPKVAWQYSHIHEYFKLVVLNFYLTQKSCCWTSQICNNIYLADYLIFSLIFFPKCQTIGITLEFGISIVCVL